MTRTRWDHPLSSAGRGRAGFTLVELVMVVTIIGIVAAIAVPRVSSASAGASANALRATVANVRKAVDIYYAEHGRYPGYDPANDAPDGAFFADQLLMCSNTKGETSATCGAAFGYGPYLRPPFPKNPTNKRSDVHVKATPADPDPADGSVGGVAVLSHGYFGVSATDVDLQRIGDGLLESGKVRIK